MTEEPLTEQFEASRARLHAIAARMLGSDALADDALQEAWLRASRAGTAGVDNVEGWLTTITSRVCLDLLRSRTAPPQEQSRPPARRPRRRARRTTWCSPTRSAPRCSSCSTP